MSSGVEAPDGRVAGADAIVKGEADVGFEVSLFARLARSFKSACLTSEMRSIESRTGAVFEAGKVADFGLGRMLI